MDILYIIVLLIILIIFILYIFNNYIEKSLENTNTEIVISRFNENLNWLNNKKFNNCNIICYNSGDNENFYKPTNMTVINIDNVGKEAYTYLYHIIHNYNKLADITMFIPGSSNSIDRRLMINIILYNIKKHNQTVFISKKYNNVQDNLYNFQIEKYYSTSKENIKKNNNSKMNLSNIRPFGLWYQNMFGDLKTNYVNFRGIIAIHKNHILQKNKNFYEILLSEIKTPNDEVLHYFERSWEAIFYPLTDAIFVSY
jgi:hypothetical protein